MKHIKENASLYVDRSTIPQAGNGLFTRKAFKAGRIICYFAGELIDDAEAAERNEGDRIHSFVQLSSGMILDTYGYDCFAKWANDARDEHRNNCRIFTTFSGTGAYLAASRDIDPGNEIFFDYGEQYWEAMALLK